VNSGDEEIDFAYLKGSLCYLVVQEDLPARISVFNVYSAETKRIKVSESSKCTCIEHINVKHT